MVFDRVMLLRRLKEEELIVLKERRVSSLRRHQDSVKLIYSKAMGQDTSLLEDDFIDDLLEEDLDDIYDSIHCSSDDEESITDSFILHMCLICLPKEK
ncbi:unnamed protein product [Coregonus sp. 'balchen']|nr:unnamed protein product [Coregonus sp. 'balchen']